MNGGMKSAGRPRFDALLLGIALLSAFLNGFGIWKNQYANAYYTAAVRSMLQNFHNFFFASFDPGGFVSIDKPPVAFWIQTASAFLFGLHGWSVVLPQALAGVGSVLLMYLLIKPTFGRKAALLASLVAACTPIAVAVSRTNNVDSLLVFNLLAATWMLFRGIRKQKQLWIVASFALIGVAFNVKMLQAYMILPAFCLFYLLAFRTDWKRKLGILAAAVVVLLVVSASWAVIVDYAVAQEDRPYVGGSQTNSVLELTFGYNGLNRLTGMGGGGGNPPGGNGPRDGGPRENGTEAGDGNRADRQNRSGSMPGGPNGAMLNGPDGAAPGGLNGSMPGGFPPGNGNPGPVPTGDGGGSPGRPGGGGAFGTGQPGLLRLFQAELSDQTSWLLPFVAFAGIALLAGVRRKKPLTPKQGETIFWLGWLLPAMAFFSIAGFFHHYYLIMLAPPIAALVGAGWAELWSRYRSQDGWISWLLPAALLAAMAFETVILQRASQQLGIVWYFGIGAAGIELALVLFLLLARKKEKLSYAAALAGMLVLLAAPLYWSATPLLYGDNSSLPEAGQQLKPSGRGPGGMGEQIDSRILDYIVSHQTGEKYLFATTSSHTAAPYIIQTGKPVMAMGGFSGSDPILTVDKLKQMIKNKEVKYFLISGGFGGNGPGGPGNSDVLEWIRSNGTVVEIDREQQTGASSAPSRSMREGMILYQVDAVQ